eukprot:TRINITY_DN32467_c0_g1_i1.p2 TRINITY_DN32467_c0_g1~~TRINITY_DN32467_c0_g1_i1.p2  ORF type:complete len:230 (+),score=79.78 TRINITY_DN32467_c0_g1_i1:76-690(+)
MASAPTVCRARSMTSAVAEADAGAELQRWRSADGAGFTVSLHLLAPGGVTMSTKLTATATEQTSALMERVCANVGGKLRRSLQPHSVVLVPCDEAQRAAGAQPGPVDEPPPAPEPAAPAAKQSGGFLSRLLPRRPRQQRDTGAVPDGLRACVLQASERSLGTAEYIAWCLARGREPSFDVHLAPPPRILDRRGAEPLRHLKIPT